MDSNERVLTIKDYDYALLNYLNGDYSKLSESSKKIFLDNVPDFDNQNVTLRSLCDLLGLTVPARFEAIADNSYTVAFRSRRVKPGNISLVIRSSDDFCTVELANQYQDSIDKGAALVIMGRDEFEKLGLKESECPVILMDHSNERIFRMFSIIKKQQKAKVVMLTGSVGKTTTKDLCHTVANSHFKTFSNANNTNTPHQIAAHLFYNTNLENEVYIHEAGAGYFGSVRFSASMLQPDVLVLTNVYNHHLQVYRTYENIFADKVSGDDYLSPSGVVVTNYDDENIRKHTFKHTVKSFSINYPDADYRALNIRQHQENLSFDIFEKETGKTTPVSVQILGEHNVYNILAAFVLGKVLGMTDTEAADALLEYRTGGVRQNLVNIGGTHFLLDCYNAAEESLEAMLAAGQNFELDEGGRKIALIGGENKLGKDVKARSYKFGQDIAKYNIDQYLFCGTHDRSIRATNHFGDAMSVMEGFKEVSNIPCEFAGGIDDMVAYMKDNVKRGDFVMIKGLYYLQMPIAFDRVFGTSYAFDLSHNKDAMKKVQKNGYQANLIEDFGWLEVYNAPVQDGHLRIPNRIKDYPVFRIRRDTFRGKTDITSIEFNKRVMNIGSNAFSGCTGLTELNVPANVKVIESGAFSDCANLQTVKLHEGTTHLGYKSFANCPNLKKIYIPETVGMIEEKAFADTPNVCIICPANSFAHGYAVKHNIAFSHVDVSDNKTALAQNAGTTSKTITLNLQIQITVNGNDVNLSVTTPNGEALDSNAITLTIN